MSSSRHSDHSGGRRCSSRWRSEQMSDGGTFPGHPGQAGSSAAEMPPLVRTPTPSPSGVERVSDPLPFERPARATVDQPLLDPPVDPAVERAGEPTPATNGTAAAEVPLGPTGRPMITIPEPGPVVDRGRARVI